MRRVKEWGGALLVIGLVAALSIYTSFFQRCASCLVYPVLLTHSYCVEPVLKRVTHSNDLAARYDALKNEYDQLQEQVVALQGSGLYLQATKELREFNRRYQKSGRICRILARTLSDHEQTFLIEGGKQAGICIDMMVMYRNVVIGRVMEVYPWYSKVCLITDKRCKIGAYCSSTRAQGVLEGFNDKTQARLQYVDHLAKVAKGDLVLTSGEGLIFPEGFGLGRVTSVMQKGLYHEIRVVPLLRFDEVSHCSVWSHS